MNKLITLASTKTLLPMIQKFLWIAPALMLCLLKPAYSQTEHPFSQVFSTAISRADVGSLTDLLDEEVELTRPGENGTFRKQAVSHKLNDFLKKNPPARFLMKHQGASADGQLYAIGQLTTQTGGTYKVLLRARPEGSHYRIFKLEVLQNL